MGGRLAPEAPSFVWQYVWAGGALLATLIMVLNLVWLICQQFAEVRNA